MLQLCKTLIAGGSSYGIPPWRYIVVPLLNWGSLRLPHGLLRWIGIEYCAPMTWGFIDLMSAYSAKKRFFKPTASSIALVRILYNMSCPIASVIKKSMHVRLGGVSDPGGGPAASERCGAAQVLLVSSQEALLSRLMLRRDPKPSTRAQETFRSRAFGCSRAAQKKTYSIADLDTAAKVTSPLCAL